jgi:hypothetical protein
MTDEILHVHHWHKRKIYCSDPKTNKEDLPDIECCCRCTLEREIQQGYPVSGSSLTWGAPKSLDKARKLEQKREFEGAKQTLVAYHAKKELCDDMICRHSKAQHINGSCRVIKCECKEYRVYGKH